ncbi:MAG: hypothetical protein K2P06_03420, partial [Muribaculaceae bacterium]|nr:hypothetical protein [Muribaculaceae bacterium]
EFAVQNETVQAALDKCKNRANELKVELGERLYPLMKHFLTTGSALMRVLLVLVRFIDEHKGAIVALSASIAAYLIVVNLAIIKQKVWTALCIAGKAAMLLWSAAVKLGAAAVALFSGNVRKAHLIWNAFARSINAHPLGLLIAAITAAVGLLIAFAAKSAKATTEAERLARAQKKIADAEKEAEVNCAVELRTLEALYKATQDQSLAMEQRLNAVARLQEQYPDYFKDLSQEAILAGNAADAYERLRQSIIRSAQAEARKDLLAETERDILTTQRERDRKVNAALADVNVPDNKRLSTPMYEGEYGLQRGYVETEPALHITKGYIHQVEADAAKKLAQLYKERDLLGTSVANDVVDNTSNTPRTPTPTPTPTPTDSKPDRFAEETAWREREEAEARIAYAKGETTFAEHTAQMATIAADYNQMLLDREDLSANERLKIQADYWEAVNKETVSGNKVLLDEEDRTYQDLFDRLRTNHEARLNQEGLTAAERQQESEYYAEVLELAE